MNKIAIDAAADSAAVPTLRRRALVGLLAAQGLSLVAWRTAHAAASPLRIVVATAAGGVPDAMARVIAQQITLDSGRAAFVENRLGAGGAVAAAALQNAPADGGTVLLVESGSYAIAPHMNRINPFGDLAPVGLAATAPIFLCVNAQTGIENFEQFVAFTRKNPGTPYGSSGLGSSHHLSMEYLRSMLKLQMTHVPYRGAGQAVLAVISGDVKAAFLGWSTAAPQAAAGKLRILGIASASRNKVLSPDMPTIAEVGGPALNVPISLGLFAHPKTAAQEVGLLNKQFARATNSDNVRNKLVPLGIESADGRMTPQQYAALTRREFALYGDIVRAANLKAE
jgi:tripartite-type tricarboxylate transporter receptor subunit TctC